MTTSAVNGALGSISASIVAERAALSNAKARIGNSVGILNSLPTIHAAAIAEINGYTPTGAFETLCKNQLTLLTTEFVALKVAAQGAVTNLTEITEF